MDNKTIWYNSDTIQYQQLTSEYLEEALTFMELTFFAHENICKTIGMVDDPAALKEVRKLTRSAAKDGVTVVAIDKSTKKIVGAAFNKLQVRNNPVFENFAKSWKRDKAQAIVAFMAYFDSLCNLFDYCNTECIFEFMFLATSPAYSKKGIARKLTEISLEIATNLANGINVKKSIDGSDLILEPAPKIMSAIFTSFITQKIGREFGFEIAVEKRYDELDFRGLDFSKAIESGTTLLTLEYKKLKTEI